MRPKVINAALKQYKTHLALKAHGYGSDQLLNRFRRIRWEQGNGKVHTPFILFVVHLHFERPQCYQIQSLLVQNSSDFTLCLLNSITFDRLIQGQIYLIL